MAKFVTRTSKYTDATITVFNASEMALEKRIIFVAGWYKDFSKGGDGWDAINSDADALKKDDVLVMVNEVRNATEKRRITMADWLKYSTPCNDDEMDDDDTSEE